MTLAAVATAYASDPQPRIRIDVTGGVGSAGLTIIRTDPDGRSRPVIVEANPRLTAGGWIGYDYHAPFNQPVTYTVTSSAVAVTTASATLAMTDSWLIHRTNTSLSVKLDKVVNLADQTLVGTSAIQFAFGARYPVTRTEGQRRAPSGSLEVRCDSPDNLQSILDLLDDSGTLLVNLADPDPGWWDLEWAWIQPGDVGKANPGGWLFYPHRHVNIPFQVVDTPSATIAASWTLQNVADTFATLTEVAATYTSLANLAIDFRSA